MDNAYITERITKTKALIEALEDTAIGIASGAIESYKLDTGQTNQWVTKTNIKVLNDVIDSLYNRCATLQARLTGSNVLISRPNF